MSSLVIGVSYRTDEHALRFLRSLARYSPEDVSVMLVDNTEREDATAFQGRVHEENSEAMYLRAPVNLGYFGGANHGLQRYLAAASLPDWVVVCNVDIEFQDADFFEKLRQLEAVGSLGAVGPRIWSTRWKRDLNPKITRRPSREKMLFYKVIFGNYYLQIAYEVLSYAKNLSKTRAGDVVALVQRRADDGQTGDKVDPIYAVHGSCIALSRKYFAAGGSLEYSAFLFGEEIFVGETARRLGLLVAHCPGLRVIDSEHASTGIIRSRRIARHMKDATDHLAQKYFAGLEEPGPAPAPIKAWTLNHYADAPEGQPTRTNDRASRFGGPLIQRAQASEPLVSGVRPLQAGARPRATESGPPAVTVITPCRNEERFIARCLDSILASDYPTGRLEVLVVDGMSEDRTRAIVADFAARYPFVRLVDNPKKSIPAAMNAGIRCARGDTVIKMDAHSTYQPDHISACVRYQKEYGAENVGGIWKMLPGAETKIARAIVLALGHPFGSGNAYIKVGVSKPTWSDTAAFGCYRKELFARVGLFNEKLRGSSDLDMNARIRSHGGRILVVPDIVISYYADGTWRSFWKHNFADGVWATYVMKFGSRGWRWRHWVPLAFVGSLVASLLLSLVAPYFLYFLAAIVGAYVLANVGASLQVALRERAGDCLPVLPLVFGVRHVAHGLGALFGLLLLFVPGEHWKGRRIAKV